MTSVVKPYPLRGLEDVEIFLVQLMGNESEHRALLSKRERLRLDLMKIEAPPACLKEHRKYEGKTQAAAIFIEHRVLFRFPTRRRLDYCMRN